MIRKSTQSWFDKLMTGNGEMFDLVHLKEMYRWRLLDKVCRIFVYKGLPFPQHELEMRAMIAGFAGVVSDAKQGIMTAWGSMSGPTMYADIFKKFTYAAPTAKGGTLKIGENCVILRNTSLCQSMYDYIDRFAELYAHNDISLRLSLINSRYQDIIKTKSIEKVDSIEDWYKGLYEGKLCAIIDDTPMSEFNGSSGDIETMTLTRVGDVDYTRFTELENELTRSFYREIGVRWNKDKKSNLVAGEVEQDNMLLQFNVNDMLECRKTFCNEYNKVFNASISVELAIPIEGEDENIEQEKDNNTGISENREDINTSVGDSNNTSRNS